ncbi:hypothetical protein BS47DRAFT_1400879 [Hydnum rufescens UP504]|uniref:Uncharacterized protein n=1 Tax=Hydnum rufescens UP504 TaxID=1448309 RepID=A0A9P6DN59_9AGAM|nr:hypothetical protein BS47DRAFT_1400879 [Hydnum rufescens UP504]
MNTTHFDPHGNGTPLPDTYHTGNLIPPPSSHPQHAQTAFIVQQMLSHTLEDIKSPSPSEEVLSLFGPLSVYMKNISDTVPTHLSLPPNITSATEFSQAYSKMPALHKKQTSNLDPYVGGEHSGKKAKHDANASSCSLQALGVISTGPIVQCMSPVSSSDR